MINKIHDYVSFFTFISIALLFNACSGGEADYSLTEVYPYSQGKFIDNAVEGLEYTRSNGESSVTSKGGFYKYRNGELITFHVGALILGTSTASAILTPRELASNPITIKDLEINNRVRFMLALDSDEHFGIQIDSTTRYNAKNWKSDLDFSLGTDAFSAKVLDVTYGDVILKHDFKDANDHFAKTLRCAYSGAYQGAWNVPDSNESTGYVGVMLQADRDVYVMGDGQDIPAVKLSFQLISPDGTVFPSGFVLNSQEDSIIYVVGKHKIDDKTYSFDTNVYYYYNKQTKQIIGIQDDANRISGIGKSITYNYIDGTFAKGEQSGKYEVVRADASRNASFRYTGLGVQDGIGIIGLLIMDIEKDGKVIGLIHDARDTTIQPKLQGLTDFVTGAIDITVNMDGVLSRLTGNLYENDTQKDQLQDVNLSWHNMDNSETYGYVEIDGCQLQSIN